MNEKAEFVVDILKQYAKETGSCVRSTMDLSPLEEWLLMRLYENENENEKDEPEPIHVPWWIKCFFEWERQKSDPSQFICRDCEKPTKEYRDQLCEPCHKWHTDS